jgi:hypothetical protein
VIVVVAVQVGALKICVAAVKALRKKGKRGSKQDEIQFTAKTVHF